MIIRNPEPMSVRKKAIAWSIFVILMVIFGSFVVYATKNGQPDQQNAPANAGANAQPEVYGVAVPFILDGLRYVVQDYQEMQIYNGHKTSGKFVVVEVSVKNVGNSPKTVDSRMFVLWDDQKRRYENNSLNDISVLDDKYFSLDTLNPGIVKEGRVSFEVPSDATGFILAVRDNMFDFGGAKYQYVMLSR